MVRITRITCALFIGGLLLRSSDARADWYQDVRQIVQQLIEDDIAKNVIPNAAAKVPGLCKFFPASISAVQQQRFSGLPSIVRREFADAVGYQIAISLSTTAKVDANRANDKSTESMKDATTVRVEVANEKLNAIGEGNKWSKSADAALTGVVSAPMDTNCDFKSAESIGTKYMRSCMSRNNDLETDMICSVALVARDAINGDTSAVSPSLRRVGIDIIIGAFKRAPIPQLQTLATDRRDELVDVLDRALRGDVPVSSLPQSIAKLAGLGDRAAIQAEIASLSSRLLLAAASSQTTIDIIIGSFKSSTVVQVKALVASHREEIVVLIDRTLRGTIQLSALPKEIAKLASPAEQAKVEAEVTGLLSHLESALVVDRTAIEAQLTSLNASLDSFEKSASTINDLVKLVVARSRGEEVTIEQFLAAIENVTDTCRGKFTICKRIADFTKDHDNELKTLTSVIRHLQAKNYGAAADQLLQLVASPKCDKEEGDACSDTGQKALTFVRKLVVYTVDAATSGNTTSSASEDFRKAAVDLIESSGGAGIRRVNDHVSFFVPSLGLRKAHRTDIKDNSTVVSLDLGSIRFPPFRYNENVYIAAHVTLIDALGPFTEIALRDSALGRRQGFSWYGIGTFAYQLVAPRLDLDFALPGLSSNLSIGVGIAFHFWRVENRTEGLTYCFFGQTCRSDDERTWANSDNFEFSAFAKYVL